jgi:hypothetical protein
MRKLALALLAIGFGQILLLGQTYQETFEHARSSLKQKQFAEALDEARQAVHLDNTRWEGWFVAGTAAVGLEKNDLALDYFQEALSRAPDAVKPTVSDAIAACRKVIASNIQPQQASPSPQVPQVYSPQPQYAPPSQTASRPPNAPSGIWVNGVSFLVFHRHFASFGPGILTVGPTVSFRETESGPIYTGTFNSVSINSNDTFSVPAQQVRFSFKFFGLQYSDSGDVRAWEEKEADGLHGRPKGRQLTFEAGGKKWDLVAPDTTLNAIIEALTKVQNGQAHP